MIKFLSNNLVETASLAASTANAQYPVANIQDDFRTKVWRSTSNSDNVVFDLGSIEDVDYLAIVDNWKSGFGIATVTVEANATDVWTSPAFTTTLTLDSTFGVSFKSITEQSYRYWRFVVTSTLGYCELSNVFIGKAVDISTNGVEYNWKYRNRDIKKVSTSRYGQEFIDDIGQRKELTNLSIKVMNTTELDQFFSVFDTVRTVKPVWISLEDSSNVISNDSDRFSGIYKFISEPSLTNFTSGFWNVTFSLREQK